MAPPSSCWRNVVTAREIDQFAIGEVGGRDVQRDGRVVTQPEISSTDAPQFGRQQAWNPSTAPRNLRVDARMLALMRQHGLEAGYDDPPDRGVERVSCEL